jgi:D-alanyl-D-alanine carboxypeptidase
MKLLNKKNNFLYLTMLVFVFVSSSAMAISGQTPVLVQKFNQLTIQSSKVFSPLPVLGVSTVFPVLSAQGVMAVDLTSGISLYEKNPDNTLLPASTTKIVTALVVLDSFPLDQVITVGKTNIDGQKMGLTYGEQIKVEDLLYGLLVYSANDAAEALADAYPGGRDAFITAMNTKAEQLNMNKSKFQNPVGYDGESQISTARDLVRVSEAAMRNPEFAKIVGTKNITVTDVTGKQKYNLRNINELLGVVPGVMGVKTGWTQNARENLVTYLERDGHKIMIAILGSQDRFGETKELIDWIFSSYKWEAVTITK